MLGNRLHHVKLLRACELITPCAFAGKLPIRLQSRPLPGENPETTRSLSINYAEKNKEQKAYHERAI